MSFRHLPPREARRLRGVLALAYVATTWAGLSALIWTPTTITGALGLTVTYAWGTLAVLGGAVGIWAVARDQWRIERWSAPLAAGGAVTYAVAVWSLVFTETSGRAAQASWITVVALLLIYRVLEVWAVASRDRATHDEARRRRRGR